MKSSIAEAGTIEKRKLGNSGLEIAPLVLGGNVFGWTADEPTSFRILDAFVDAGFNMIDTANSYSSWVPGHPGGESETIIGRWLKTIGKRQTVLIATKVGSDLGPSRKGLSKDVILRELEGSLQRLQTDHIDLYQSHFDDLETPLEETLAAYDQLIKQGKVRAIGASNYNAERLSQALKVSQEKGCPRYETLQPHYNLAERSQFEGDLAGVCQENRLGVIPYFSLASGFLTGKYRNAADATHKAREISVSKYLNERGFRILQALDEVAERHNATPAQVSLAWLMARPPVTAPIASATSVEQLESLVAAATLRLDETSLEQLNQASG
ncbi:MAG: putative oxidoreductase, aryl-alcohol dehydrogenase like protein [Verrucomicrobiales bacterium]|nr:putative oxidoreductase, aryl-alcohol dehydrogenase like protein [Verrucomicrobiales bacterium]